MSKEHERSGGTTDERLIRVTLGEPLVLNGPVALQEYDAGWLNLFATEAARIRRALGNRALCIEHVGSTSVPGLAAKPVVDILLVVNNSADEPSYVPGLEAAGYVLRIREPDWHEHRMFKSTSTDVNLHVFTLGSPEIERVLLFRDRLRSNFADRQLYADTKRQLASRTWKYVQNYADAKAEVIEAIINRARLDGLGG